MKYLCWAIFIFVFIFLTGCGTEDTNQNSNRDFELEESELEYIYQDINLNKNIGLKVIQSDSDGVRLFYSDGNPFTGVIRQNADNSFQDSLMIDEKGYPFEGKWKLYNGFSLVEEGFYSQGLKDSIWVYYTGTGIPGIPLELSKKTKFDNGSKKVEYEYRSDGSLEKELPFNSEGKIHGNVKVYNIEGEIILTLNYRDGLSPSEYEDKLLQNKIYESIESGEHHGWWTIARNETRLDVNVGYSEYRARLTSWLYPGQRVYDSGSVKAETADFRTFDDGTNCYYLNISGTNSDVWGSYSEMCYDSENNQMLILDINESTWFYMSR